MMPVEAAPPVLYSASFLVLDSATVIESGAVLVEDGRVVATGTQKALAKQSPQATVVNYENSVILPAFVNAHTHLELSLYPQWASAAGVESGPCSFVDWILRLIKVKRTLKPQDMRSAVEAGMRMCLEAGTAAIGDILSSYDARELYRNTPLSGRLYLESLGQDRTLTASLYSKLLKVLKEREPYALELAVSPHSPYTIRPAYMRQLYQLCQERDLFSSTHLAESSAEVDFLDSGEGELVDKLYQAVNWHQYRPDAMHKTPVDFLRDQGGLTEKQLLVHGVQLTSPEIHQIAEAKTALVLCPRSNAHLQVGTAPVLQLKRAGVKLALGTDSLASNRTLSMWDELSFAADAYSDAFTPTELFDLATVKGAEALGLTGLLGCLNPGYRGTFQVVDAQPGDRSATLIDSLVCNGRVAPVNTMVIDGVCAL